MKYNLESFPEVPICRNEKDRAKLVVRMINWRFGFEKELRAQLVDGEKAEKAWRGARKHRVDEEVAMEWHGSNLKIKEVLGVEPKIKEETKR
jgi:hypothetical protein